MNERNDSSPVAEAVPLSRGWSLWTTACLRGAGFPAQLITGLAAPRSARAIDALLESERSAAVARQQAKAVLDAAQRSKPVNRALKALAAGRAPETSDGLDAVAAAAVDHVRVLETVVATRRSEAMRCLEQDDVELADRVISIAREPRFREALLWQNPVAARGASESLIRGSADAHDSKSRQQRRLIAGYLSRYCVKNDTIGFFGPVGWARLGHDATTRLQVGSALLSRRRVYFEHWGIEALATAACADGALRAALKPRRTPTLWLDGSRVQLRDGSSVELPAVAARVLAAVDGERTAHAIAEQVLGDASLDLTDHADVYDVLAALADKHLCTFEIEIPASTWEPEAHLRRFLEQAGPAGVNAQRALAELEMRREAIGRAAGDPDALDRALAELSATFEGLAGIDSVRKGGQTYAGRTLVYEDTRRDLELELGRGVIDRLAEPLAMVLDSARWYTHAIATRYQAEFRRLYDALVAERAGAEVPFVLFRDRIVTLFPGAGEQHSIAGELTKELQSRWEQILNISDWTAARHERHTRDIANQVDTAFHAPGPGWPSARHHSPDLMIAARSLAELQRGELKAVLGEIHIGFNTVTLPCLLKEHPSPNTLVRAREADLPEPAIAPTWTRARNRADFYSVSRHDYDLEVGGSRSARPRDQVIAAGELIVSDRGGELVARTRDGRLQFPLLALLEQHLIAETFSRFQMIASRPHTPRIELDDLVLCREKWVLGPEALGFAFAKTPFDRLVEARRLAQSVGLPRRVFVKSDNEPKPFYVDFESPLLVEVLAKQVKQASRVSVTEMLPAIEDCWLPDASGATYTSELRLAATDATRWSGSLL